MRFQMRDRTWNLSRVAGCILLVQMTGCGFFGPRPIPTDAMEVIAEGISGDEKFQLHLRHRDGHFPETLCVLAKQSGEDVAVFVYPEEIEPPVGMEKLDYSMNKDGQLIIRTEYRSPIQWVINGERSLGKWQRSGDCAPTGQSDRTG